MRSKFSQDFLDLSTYTLYSIWVVFKQDPYKGIYIYTNTELTTLKYYIVTTNNGGKSDIYA